MQKTDELVNTLVKAVDDIQNKKAKGYDTQATVTRIEGGTAYVHIPGGVDETPAQMTITAKKGDTVRVRVANGTAWLVGNATAPPTDDATANAAVVVANTATTMAGDAIESANIAAEAAESAKTSATEAKADAIVANQAASNALRELSTVENVVDTLEWITAHGTMTLTSDVVIDPSHVYFVVDPTGQYVVGGTHYSIVEEPKQAELNTYYELTIDDAVTNYVATHIVVDTEGLWIVPDTNNANRVLIAHGNGSTYTTAGTYVVGTGGVILAQFTTDGMTSQTKDGNTTVTIAHLGYGAGADNDGGTSNAPYYDIGIRQSGTTIGNYSTAEGWHPTASAYCAHAEGWGTVASGKLSHAECNQTTASGANSHAEGVRTESSGDGAHAEGYRVIASGAGSHAEGWSSSPHSVTAANYGAHAEGYADDADVLSDGFGAHAEGSGTTATGTGAHAEGYHTNASGFGTHAEGRSTTATGLYSHAGGTGTCAGRLSQTAIGEYNVLDPTGAVDIRGDYAFIIGNGTADNARSNALTVAWTGDVAASGDVNIGSGKHYKINGANLSATDIGALPTRPTSIEFQPSSSSAGNGGFIDFHYNQSSADYTSRIIEAASGALTVSGSLTVGGHSSAIGTVKQAYATAKTVNNNTNTNLTSISLEAGTWVITAGVRFPSNATGLRRLNVTTSSGSANADVQLMAVNGGSTQLAYTLIVSPTATTTYYLNCYQNSGSNLSLSAGGGENGLNFIRAVRIA